MAVTVRDPELFGVTEDSATLAFLVEDGGAPVDAPVRILLDGEERAVSQGAAPTRLVRLEGLEPGRRYRLELRVDGAGEPVAPDRYLPESFETLPAPAAECVLSFATLNDLHFGEPRFGGTLTDDWDYGPEQPGFPAVHAGDTEIPYWRFMNEDAIAEINEAGVDLVVIKGDIADRGRPEQFADAREAFSRLEAPYHAFLGNHDHYALADTGEEVDGYALLGQPPAPRFVDVAGWRLVMLETALPGEHHGVFDEPRRRWLEGVLDETRELGMPTLLFMHHHPVPPEVRDRYPNSIGIVPEDSVPFFEQVGRHPQVRAVLIGHTHRNRVRLHPAAGPVPFVEVNCTKDYPGGWAHYRLFADGSLRQEVRRTASARALAHSTHCRTFFNGMYRYFALGPLEARSFQIAAPGRGRRA